MAERRDRGDGREGAVNILYKRDIEKAADSAAMRAENDRRVPGAVSSAVRRAAERGYVDEVILPRMTRASSCRRSRRSITKRDRNPPKKHGNIPL